MHEVFKCSIYAILCLMSACVCPHGCNLSSILSGITLFLLVPPMPPDHLIIYGHSFTCPKVDFMYIYWPVEVLGSPASVSWDFHYSPVTVLYNLLLLTLSLSLFSLLLVWPCPLDQCCPDSFRCIRHSGISQCNSGGC